jgi:hypothetical protein
MIVLQQSQAVEWRGHPAAASKFNIAYFQPLRILEAIMGPPTLSHFLSIGCENLINGTQNAQNKASFGCACE